MAQPNYQFEKRRREMDKKAKKAEKLKRKQEPGGSEDAPAEESTDGADTAPATAATLETP